MMLHHQEKTDDQLIIFDLLDALRLPRLLPASLLQPRQGDSIMQIDIQARGFKLTDGLRNQAERRVRFALGSSSSKVRRIVMSLADENGPRGGVDKRCTIRANLSGSPPVIIEQQESDLYVAIDRAADRVARTLSRRLERSRGARRSPPIEDSAPPDADKHVL
jgi:putative sigma-54 modulation protein